MSILPVPTDVCEVTAAGNSHVHLGYAPDASWLRQRFDYYYSYYCLG